MIESAQDSALRDQTLQPFEGEFLVVVGEEDMNQARVLPACADELPHLRQFLEVLGTEIIDLLRAVTRVYAHLPGQALRGLPGRIDGTAAASVPTAQIQRIEATEGSPDQEGLSGESLYHALQLLYSPRRVGG